jgi:hypothetical protein
MKRYRGEDAYITAYFPTIVLCDLHAVCASVNPTLLTSDCLNQILWKLACLSRKLSPSHVCLYVYPSHRC